MEPRIISYWKTILPSSLHEQLVKSSIAKRLVRGSLWSLFGSATARILVLVAMILVARILGQESFGEFALVQATLGVAGLVAGMALGGTATRFVAKYAAVDPLRAGRVIALVMSISVCTVLSMAAVLILASDAITNTMLNVPRLQTALIWGSLLMAATAFRGIQGGVFAGLEQWDTLAKLNVLDGVVSLVAMITFASYMGVEGAVLGLAIGAAVVWLVGRVLLMGELRSRDIKVRYKGCWADRRILTEYSMPSFMASMVATPVLWFAMVLVGRSEHGLAGLGLYNAAYQWHSTMVFIPMILMSVSMPVLVQEWEAGRIHRFRAVTFWVSGLMLALVLPIATLGAFLSPWIMSLYGPGFQDGWMVLVLLLAATPFHALAKIATGALLGMNRAWWVLACNLIWGATILAVTNWLVPSKGVMGLAVAFLSAYSILAMSTFISILVGFKPRVVSKLPLDTTKFQEEEI